MKYILANKWLRNICLCALILFTLQLSAPHAPQSLTMREKGIAALFFGTVYLASWWNNQTLHHFFLPKNQFRTYFIFLMLLLVGMVLVQRWAFMHLPIPENESWSVGRSLFQCTLFLFLGFGINSAYREIMRRQEMLERELLTKRNELRFLQNQVNPHFLFNSLNNLYSASMVEPEKVSERILQMAELLRYQLSCSKREFVPLEEEVAFLLNYLDVEKRRLGRQVILNLESGGDFNQKNIAPLLFLPFLENAFKYSTGAATPANIHIQIETAPNSLHFFCKNSLPENAAPLPVSTGIGIENTRKRLELLYPGQHELTIISEMTFFSVDLKIQV